MSERKISAFYRWLLLSLLVHLAIAALVLLQQPKTAVKPPKPVPITVFAINRQTRPESAKPETVKAETEKPQTLQPRQKTAATVQPPKPVRQRKPASAPAVKTISTPVAAAPVSTPPVVPTDISTLLGSVAARTAQRALSSAELAALTTPKAEASAKPETNVRRPAVKPGSGPAADVLETLPDGSQLVRVGKGCVLATPGADLRKDIHSMKVVGCGAGGRSEQDRIEAHFDQMMSKLGQYR
ncbi:MAG: hypothetical protein E6Q75_14900 [Rheinheimera sp.]|nr:MAG: hypothetical protein E6Q75_14900 [Rheinheimera sp.]